ncbi:MAG: hypothetical protein Unbinned4350contig1002_10 [Prokaryotic dsDNA virus sp.]|nr:MAG: hypothetical protein Unbinned4350contig1002_10 [Prokaryotic dsDNA virus sp.]|tara:strand:- start:13568 stop:14512 length:945 start_codon:yes stop_codon:yes gene_type:complete
MPATTTTDLAALIPTELISGVLVQNMGDKASLIELCAFRGGFKSYEFAELGPLTAAGVTEGAALATAAVTPVGTTINASPQEVAPVQITRLALESEQGPDWLNLSGALGKALKNRANAQICATFDDTFNGNRNTAQSSTGGGAPAAMDLHTLELALEIAAGNNSKTMPFGADSGLAAVLHPSQVAGLRADIRGSSNYVTREDILAIYPALPTDGLVFGYYNCAVYSSIGVTTSGFEAAAGTGVRLATGAALSSGNTKKGALFSINEAVGFVMQRDPNIRSEETVLIGSGGVNIVAGYVGESARISEQLTMIESL